MRASELSVFGVALCLIWVEVYSQCNGRKVLTARTGTISDGNGNYTPVAHCEWLIDGNGNSSILLTFSMMKTECSYDFLFVYDGDSYEKPLMASLSGDQIPKPLLATSGYMLVYLYSDRNYELAGFQADYKIMDCPYECKNRGSCRDGKCHCIPNYYGIGCEKERCPNGCSANLGQGDCEERGKCKCKNGFMGENCSMFGKDGRGNNTWYVVASDTTGFQARTSHAGVFIESLDSVWIFGGFTLNEVLDELILFNMTSNQWETVEHSVPWPAGRYLHAMVALNDGFVMYGGQLITGELSDELWFFDAVRRTWTLVSPGPDADRLPRLASHSLTLGKDWIYLFGGKTQHGFFSSDLYRIRSQNLSDWQRIFIKGGKIAARRLAGHSAVYHEQTNTLLIFGGHSTNTAQFSRLQNKLHIFHIDNSFWSLIADVNSKDLPSERAYHSAVILGDYMVIYGGNTHVHDGFELCYDAAIYYYHLGCYKWISDQYFNKKFPGLDSSVKPSRRFGHVAMAAYGNTLLISGGYSGYVLGDLLAFKVAPPIAVHESLTLEQYDHCTVYATEQPCLLDPACSLCDSVCVNRASQNCTKRGKEAICEGFCKHLRSCDSCLNLGSHYPTAVQGDNSWYYQQFQYCSWCVKEAECQPANALSDTCLKQSSHNTATGRLGWWAGVSVHLTELRQCLTEDRPAGLHFLRYRSPPNDTYPDELDIIRKSDQELKFKRWIEKEDGKEKTPYTGKFVGYIYPLNVSGGYAVNISVGMSNSKMIFYLSKDDSPKNKEVVAEHTSLASFVTVPVARPDHTPLFPNLALQYKYYMELNSTLSIEGTDIQQMAYMKLERNSSGIPKPWTAEFLEPFRSGNCSQHYNCLACLADTACGWCTENNACHHRDASQNPGQATCGMEIERHLVIASTDCPTCIDHVDCTSCVSDELCEWVPDDLFCIRRGRFPDSILNTSMCQGPCKSHTSCESCLEKQSECAWCENLQTCFTFSEYVTRFMYGQCLKWLDWEAKSGALKLKCHSCEAHNTCKSCMENFGCGWCGTVENPAIGKCMQGDFAGPASGRNCSVIVTESGELNVNVSWAYGVCPDVQECQLNLHDCHQNASCINTLDGYNCTCDRGFVGNGKDRCDKTCYHPCDKGRCSGAPDYVCQCSLGWTGDSCNISCGCNNHSTCDRGVGTCDLCQQNTTGDNCEMCQPGSYGDPLLPTGCQPCQCNGHGDVTLGTCNNSTGKCFCIHNTDGDHCDYCENHYYGDPKNGQNCYMECDDRKILTDIKSGSLGSFRGPWASSLARPRAYCLWILTLFSDVDSPVTNQVIPTINLEIEPEIAIKCPEDYVYVYDGLPHFASGRPSTASRLLGAFCGEGQKDLPVVTARSGIITVFYQSDISQGVASRGFNASYYINECPLDCNHGNRECADGRCVCMAGFRGENCEVEVCPKNCSSALNQGYCDQGCVCKPGYVGPACELELLPNTVLAERIADDDVPILEAELGRMGHTMSKCGEDSLYIFGGYSLRHGALSSLYHLNTTTGTWTYIEPQNEDIPKGRYFHSAVCLPDMQTLYIYGGLVEQEGTAPYRHEASRELWKFGLESRIWTQEEGPKFVYTLAGHTMTQITDTRLMLIGGFSVQNYFSNKVYEYDTAGGLTAWREFSNPSGTPSGATPVGLFGHTAVFHAQSNTMYVYGGYAYKSDSFSPSRDMYSFDLDSKKWNIIQPTRGEKPIPRFFHTMVGRENDMVVIGGMTEGMEMTASIQVYRYTCNNWITVTSTDHVDVVGKFSPAIGLTAVAMDNGIYIFGGYNGISMGSVTKLTIPSDACQILKDTSTCTRTVGCSGCIVPTPLLGNQSFCYTSGLRAPDSCDSSNATLRQGEQCTESWFTKRDCQQFTNCSQCLAVYPQFKKIEPACMWCTNCNVGRCVGRTEGCGGKKCGGVEQTPIRYTQGCVEQRCQAADCDKCKELDPCLWTTHTKRTSEVMRSLASVARYTGNCVERTSNINHLLSTHEKCPRRCFSFPTCHACLDTESAEGGAKTCVWSDRLQQCFPYAAIPLMCAGGQCGYLINDPLEKSARCPIDCAFHTRCSTCLTSAGCGWCAFGGKNGSGVCMAGGLHHPSVGVCTSGQVHLATTNQQVAANNRSLEIKDPIFWSFMECPPENECENNHHNCNNETEDCVDLPKEYQCECKQGYEKKRGKLECEPQCTQGCVQGKCVRPDQCECHFGWVGRNCSVECQCNKHSNCRSENDTTNCTGCSNNTMGPQCSLCKPFFVGDPRDGHSCIPCREFCHNHTDFCVSHMESLKNKLDYSSPYVRRNLLLSQITEGPKEADAVCLSCQHNTTGVQCDDCLSGYFRIRQDNQVLQPCLKCQCNGHSSTCDEQTGENCACQNNTETSCNKDSKEKKPCWQKQCSECREYFLGNPTNGHQCYRLMIMEQDYCFDPGTQNRCSQDPTPLHQGRTVLFSVQPKYLNVNIRITVDVTEGAADVYFSPCDDTFLVDVDPLGFHTVLVDPSYQLVPNANTVFNDQGRNVANCSHDKSSYRKLEMEANELNTFVTVSYAKTLLLVKNVRFRLVITLPLDVHDLQSSKFHVILRSRSATRSNQTFGSLYFRQDQPHIDLFVFFSVFFSCFFLFLAKCVLLWKVKQTFDARRTRQQRAREMKHMASRPFARVLVYIEQESLTGLLPSFTRRNNRLPKIRTNPPSVGNNPATTRDSPFHLAPIAVEPTDDGIAAVGTVILRLPGGSSAPSKLSLGSALTMRLHSGQTGNHSQKVNIRRRYSASFA